MHYFFFLFYLIQSHPSVEMSSVVATVRMINHEFNIEQSKSL